MLCVFQLYGKHILGGAVSYTYIQTTLFGTEFNIQFDVVRDAGSMGAQFDYPAEFGIWRRLANGEFQYHTAIYASPSIVNSVIYYDDTPFVPSSPFFVQHARYDVRVTLPTNGDGYLIAYQRCCRIDGLTNAFNPEGTSPNEPGALYSIEILPEAILAKNSSPAPLEFGYDPIIRSGDFTRQFVFTDQDGDSLVYAFVTPLSAGGVLGTQGGSARDCDGITPDPWRCGPPFRPLQYFAGYSHVNPFGGQPLQIDPSGGFVDGNAGQLGHFVLGLEVREYRNGVLLGTATMDYTFRVIADRKIGGAHGLRFYDANRNDIFDGNDQPVTSLIPEFLPGVFDARFFDDGTYQIWADTGTYTAMSPDPRFTISTQPPFYLTLDQQGVSNPSHLPFVTNDDFADLAILILPARFRCDATTHFQLMIENIGSVAVSGMILLQLDQSMQWISADKPMEKIGPHQYIWHFQSLFPFVKNTLRFTLRLPSEEYAGEHMELSATGLFFPTLHPQDLDTVQYQLTGVLTCPVDPNEKYAQPSRGINNEVNPGETLTYTIHFENTGSDTAYVVRIVDQLDPAFDLRTFRLAACSHACMVEFIGRTLQITFPDIHLPPGIHDPIRSQGYTAFRITPQPVAAPGTVLHNRAFIYFDENAPIVTSEVRNLITLEKLRTSKPFTLREFNIFPNPSDNAFSLTYPEFIVPASTLRIFSATGVHIETLQISDYKHSFGEWYPQGVYFYTIHTNNNTAVQQGRIIKF